MAINSVRPGFFKLLYSGPSGQHVHVIPVRGTSSELAVPTLSDIYTQGGTTVDAATAIAAYATAVAGVAGTGVSFYGWELYSQVGDETEPILLGAGSLTGIVVTPLAAIAGNQASISFSSSLGAKGKIVLLDTYLAANQARNTFNNPSIDGPDSVRNYLLSAACIRVARGGGFPIIVRRLVTKLNDAARRNVYNI